jgi:hypothetical protein
VVLEGVGRTGVLSVSSVHTAIMQTAATYTHSG